MKDKPQPHINSVNNEVDNLLKAAYAQAVAERQIPAEFMPGKFKSEKETIPTRAITQAEHEALLAQCDKVGDEDFKDVLTAVHATGMRSGDISGLIKSQVVLDEIRIVGGRKVIFSGFHLGFDTKTGMPRSVPMSNALREVIERRIEGLQDNDYVFTRIVRGGKGRQPWQANSITRQCEVRAKQAKLLYGLKLKDGHGNRIGFTFHSYKSRMLAELVEKGASEFIIKMILGTVSAEALKAYTHSIDPGVTMRYVNGGDISDKPTYKKPINSDQNTAKAKSGRASGQVL
jgi:integrase